MRLLRDILIVLAVTAVGAAIPWLFQERMAAFFGAAGLCELLSTGEKLGHIDAAKRTRLLDAAIGANDVGPETKALAGRVRSGCN